MEVVVGGATAVAAVLELEVVVFAMGLGAKGLVRLDVKDSEVGGYDDEDVCDWDNDCDRCPERDAPEEAAELLGSPYMSRNACSAALPDPMGEGRQWTTIALIESDCKMVNCGEGRGA